MLLIKAVNELEEKYPDYISLQLASKVVLLDGWLTLKSKGNLHEGSQKSHKKTNTSRIKSES